MKSDTITKVVSALIKAKRNFVPAVKNKKNDFFKSKYVPLDAVIDVTEGALLAEGLVIVQTSVFDGNHNLLRTSLIHESGEWIQGEYMMKPLKDDPQGHGSAMTYARRYTMMAILGIAPEDDDGNAASGNAAAAKAIGFGQSKTEKAKTHDEVNADLVLAGADPIHDIDAKAAAAASYKLLNTLDAPKAKLIKHNRGTDYAKMKVDLDLAYREALEGAAK